MAGITDQQIEQLKAKVATLVADKTDEDAKTAASNTADTAASQAAAVAAQAKQDEASAQQKTGTDLADLRSFIDGLS